MSIMKAWPSARRLSVLTVALVILAATAPPAAFCESTHALSLQRLARQLQACQGSGTCPQSLLEFDGLRVIDGYVVDPEDGDVVLVGRRGGDLPPLHVEDFVVALRNAWLRYAERQGNRILYSDPGCSIDPDPTVMRELEGLASRVIGGGGESQKEWDQTCRKPQAVRVLGMPFSTHFARVMVEADYDMKTVVDGSATFGVDGLEGLTTMTLAQARRDVEAGRPISIPVSAMNRFWFYPGRNVWETADGVVLIRESPVTLLSNQMFVNAKNELVDARERDELAERFAANFTRLFDEVAAQRPIYRELEGLFRFVALAKILEAKVRSTPAEATLGYYLESFPVVHTDVPTQLPGRSNVDGFEHRQAVAGGVRIMSLRLPSCGGVSIDVEADPENFRPGRGDELSQLRDWVLMAKRGSRMMSWAIIPDQGQTLEEIVVLKVFYAENGVNVVGVDGSSEFYDLERYEDLAKEIAEQQQLADPVFLDLRGFPLNRAEAFRYDLQLMLDKVETTLHAAEYLSDPIQSIGNPTAPRKGEAGRRKGWFESTIYFVQMVEGTLQEVAITVWARTVDLLKLFIAKLKEQLHISQSLPEVISGTLRQLKRDVPNFNDGDIEIDMYRESGCSRLVEQLIAQGRVAA